MLIGRIVGAFGVRGEIKVEPLTDFPERFGALQRIYLGAGREPRAVEGTRRHKGLVLLRLPGIETPEEVKALAQTEIFVPRSEAATLPEGHFFLGDMVGMEVVTTDGRPVGPIREVIRTGSNDVFVARGAGGDVLIPVIKDAVRDLDLAGRRVTIEPWVLDTAE